MKIGDIVLPRAVSTEDTTSAIYGAPRHLAVEPTGLQGHLELALSRRLTHVENPPALLRGGVWTTDAPKCETPLRQQLFRDRGAVAIEMELAPLVLLSRKLGFHIGAGFAVSDLLLPGDAPTKTGFRSAPFKFALTVLADAVVEVIAQAQSATYPPGDLSPV
jgi:purine-nucleoside phosphorylase